jgi:hypothetical protein
MVAWSPARALAGGAGQFGQFEWAGGLDRDFALLAVRMWWRRLAFATAHEAMMRDRPLRRRFRSRTLEGLLRRPDGSAAPRTGRRTS